jgi:DNA sulfur modification protein DndD
MQLRRIEIKNFKLLEDVTLEFSVDRGKPLTAIRAENGSGKTSLLNAMLWGFYGRPGLPKFAGQSRLSSTARPLGHVVPVRVMIEFEYDGPGGRGRYRLIRSYEETPVGLDDVQQGKESLDIYRIADAGEKPVENPDVFLHSVVPGNLRDLFFTNGDDVQEFMSGKVDRTDRQGRVHQAIKALLDLDQLYVAREDLKSADRKFRKALSQDGGIELAEAERAMEEAENQRDNFQSAIDQLESELNRIRSKRREWELQLQAITDIGELSVINSELAELDTQLAQFEDDRDQLLASIREELSSERLSWGLVMPELNKGMATLEELADRGIIPGTSIEVIRDRLIDGECFCGTRLDENSPARARLEHIIEEHGLVDQSKELLTAAYHGARFQKSSHEADVSKGITFLQKRQENLGKLNNLQELINSRQQKRSSLVDRRARIDESRVKTLTDDINSADADISKKEREQAVQKHELQKTLEKLAQAEGQYKAVKKKAKLSDHRKANATAASDLLHLVAEVIRDLEVDHVKRVAEIMSSHFLEIVGSDPEIDSAIFGSVSINESFDIEVRTPQGSRLDFDAEINGASQRALTLSFIWALMEVSGVEAPRIIDTPLGMVAGAVKRRLTEAITMPAEPGAPNYQVVLLLTRSEIRDVETILDDRAGLIRTMTCSKDAKDLKFPWGLDRPRVAVCSCTHRQSCRICARTYDVETEIEFRDIESIAR